MAEEKEKKSIPDMMKSPQWRIGATAVIVLLFAYLWFQFFSVSTPQQGTISYSQFIEQLNAGNIKSVTIKNLEVNGELNKEIPIQLPGTPKARSGKEVSNLFAVFPGRGSS